MIMTKRIARVVMVAGILLMAASAFAFAEYDRDRVVQVMRENVGLMGEISEAAEAEDWELAAFKLFDIARGMIDIRRFDPPRGSKREWEATMNEFVNAAFIGIGACGEQDSEGLQMAITKLRQLNREGHGDHKPR